MASSQDHKRLRDGDEGPNTGGMGAYSPAPVVTRNRARPHHARGDRAHRSRARCRRHAIHRLPLRRPHDRRRGAPKVIEFNVRFGDPETQPVLSRLKSDLTVLCEAALAGRLDTVRAEWDPRAALGVVIAAPGYPDEVRKGDAVTGLDQVGALPGKLFHAGTATRDGKVVTAGGRVFCAVGLGATVRAAQREAYALVDAISFDGAQAGATSVTAPSRASQAPPETRARPQALATSASVSVPDIHCGCATAIRHPRQRDECPAPPSITNPNTWAMRSVPASAT